MLLKNTLRVFCGVALAFTLAACGGGGGGGPSPVPGPIDPPSPTTRGSSAAPGINQIPLSQIKVSNSQMKDMFAIAEGTQPTSNHTRLVRKAACNSYTVQCADSESYHGKHRNADGTVTTTTGSAPYTSITDNITSDRWSWLIGQLDSMPNLKILSISNAIGAGRVSNSDILPSYLVVRGAGNQGVGEDFGVLLPNSPDPDDRILHERVKRAISANKMLLIAGWDKDANGNYVRHAQSVHCRQSGVSEGCLWAQFEFPGVGSGTSASGPQVASALASVLSALPNTTHQNLAKFAKACSRKTGSGIPALLATHGGVGVVNFTCMGSVTAALANLPTGGRTNVSVNGQTVSVGARDVTLSFASPAYFAPDLIDGESGSWVSLFQTEQGSEERSPVSVRFIPTGEGKVMIVGAYTIGDAFASLAIGNRDDFFGFQREHENGIRETRFTAGHRNAFVYLSSMRSDGGRTIKSARGRSAGLMIREDFTLTERTVLSASAKAERFLGGSAHIGSNSVNFGSVELPAGGLYRQLDVSTKTVLDESTTLEFGGTMYLPENGEEDFALNTRFRVVF